MAIELAKAYLPIIPSLGKGFKANLEKEIGGAVEQAADNAGSGFGDRIFKGLKVGAVAVGTAAGGLLATSLVKGFGRLSAIESAEKKLEGLGHTAEGVSTIMDSALASVKGTAFGLDEAATTASAAVAAGVEPGKELTRYLGLVGDAATIAGTDMASMGSIFNKVMTSGKVQGDVFAQLSDAGIPVVQMLAKEMGITAEEVYKLGSEGKISSDTFIEAMSSMEGAALKGGETTTGAYKNTIAALSRFGAAVLEDIFPLIGPALNQVTEWLDEATNAVGPFMDEVVGGFRAFGAAWTANDGDITSSGFPGFMEEVAYWLHQGYDAMNKWYPVWMPFASGVAAVTGTFVAYKVALQAVATAQGIMTAVTTAWQVITGVQTGTLWGLTAAQWAALAPIALTVGALVALAVGIKMAYERVGWFRDLVDTAWAWIKSVISGVVDWFTGTAVPAFQGALAAIGDWFTGLYHDYIAPVWGWVKQSVSDVVGWFTDVAAPAIGGALATVGGWFARMNSEYVQPAMQAVKDIFGGVVSWLGEVVGWLGEKFSWLYENVIHPVWYAVMATITMVAAILLTIFQGIAWVVTTLLGPVFTWLYESVIKPVWGFIQGAIAGFMGWWQDTAVPFIQAAVWVLQQVWETYKDQLVAVWNFVTSAIQGFLDWWNGVAVPFIQAAIAVVTLAWQAFSTAVGLVWDWISSKISAVWSWVQNRVLIPAKAFLENVLVPAFIFLWNQVSNVWTWISDKISFTWNFIRGNILDPLVTFLDRTVGEAFRTLWRTVEQVWTWISDKIAAVWDWLKNSVLKPLGEYITTTFVGFFEAAKDGIGRAWSALKDLVREPVRFVIDTVINGGVIKNYNNLAKLWGGDPLDEMKFPEGFARGGVLPGYQSAKKDELLVPMRKGEGVIVPEATRALGHSFIYGINAAANNGGISGASSWLSQNFGGGYATGGVISPLKQRYPLSQGYNRVHKGIDIAAPIGTPIYATADGIITHAGAGARAPGVWGGNEIHVKSGGLERWFAHLSEIAVRVGHMVRQGDYLGKTGNTGISSGPHLHFGVFNGGWPNDIDPLSYLGGAVNFDASDLSGTGGGGGGSSIIGILAEKLTAPVRALLDTAKQKFGGNVFANIPFNIAQKTLDSVVTWVSSKFGGSESSGMSTNWEPTVRDALARAGLPVRDDYVGAWLRQIQSESGGNPRAVQNGYTDINTITGDLAQGLVQVIGSTFQAYRDPSLPNDRFDPLANLVAGMRYAKARYGASMLNVIGQGHGYALGGIVGEPPALYDKGGLINRGVQLIDHQRSTPDYVLTDQQWAAMYEIAQSTASAKPSQPAIQIGNVYAQNAEMMFDQVDRLNRQRMALAL
ncbi:peptidoglycan DD-metalloendopeptidase family protein [Rothia sp. P5764]|uniref:peptidoglycan DD-metalloendopeptidase family protein n=1 Tax=Rothia sp. P5764 TaxID=3402654 RepID=UPI003AD1C2F8